MSKRRRRSRRNSPAVSPSASVPSSQTVRPSASPAPPRPAPVPAADPEIPVQSSGSSPSSRRYEIRKQTVVFGGHATWLKVIRPMLRGNIRFIERDLSFSLNLIRNADIVWIQTNSLSHAMYARIAGSARQYHKPMRYFSFDSAVRCAQQVLEADA